jgi:acyl-CoA synthetase (AMP-forming)/AMP-acid ligase II
LLEAGALRAGDVQFLHYGSAPIHPQTLEELVRGLPDLNLVQMYGQTEGSPITCLTPQDHRDAVVNRPSLRLSVGRAVPGVEIRIDKPIGRGEGEITARGPHLYSNGAEWLRTGDVGVLDEDGYLFIKGRLNDMILRSGEKVYPSEVEQVLVKHPAVAQAAVVGVPDRRHGQRVKAFVVLREPHSRSADVELKADFTIFVRRQLAGYKVPSEWGFVDALPRNSAGKLQRHLLVQVQDDEKGSHDL